MDSKTLRAVPAFARVAIDQSFGEFLACCSVMCGGSGGASGSVLTLRTTGRSAHASSKAGEKEASRPSTMQTKYASLFRKR
jgi:hypothetical protein